MKIEDTLFNVHKYQLMKSETFSDMFKTAKEGPEEGSSPKKPVLIDGVTVSDFECLLTVLYAPHFSFHKPAQEASLIIPAFRLATKWNFKDLKDYLLPLAEKELGAVDKIVFAHEFGISEWLAPAHAELCQRVGSITTDEAVKVGVHSLLAILLLQAESHNQYVIQESTRCYRCGQYGY
ncbi:hypothetical protein FRC06_003528 [Ceratobasidium sp. 370]|nr:hypothetical protein FRC06_003528 [Ceratobasidium sp. 370]